MPEPHIMHLENWLIDTDPENAGVARGWSYCISETAHKTTVPSIIQQVFPDYHGVAFYWCRFKFGTEARQEDALLLRFDGVDYKATVWLNGVLLGEHEGGEAPFTFDVTDKLDRKGENLLTVRVVNPTDEDIDGLNALNVPNRNKVTFKRAGSSLNHGGIWYGVSISRIPAAYIVDRFAKGDIELGSISMQVETQARHAVDAVLTVRVYEKTSGDRLITEASRALNLPEGRSETQIEISVANAHLWDVDDPFLYRLETELSSPLGRHIVSQQFGFRELKVEDGFFRLNRRRIFLKSSHTCNHFPIGQMLPVVPSMTRQDLYYAKACGFNMIRAIAGMLRPEQLDFCDEIGLMVYEECMAAWCLGQEVGEKPMPIGDEAVMLRRFDDCQDAMIKRDRNHPCITAWGLLNETFDGPVFRHAVAYLPRARELDPTRLIFLSSGRIDSDDSIGSVSNPYNSEWETQWGFEGTDTPDKLERWPIFSSQTTGDFHSYPVLPAADVDIRVLRFYGEDSRPVFLSEFGTGALFDVIDEWRCFQQKGCRPDLEDMDWVRRQSEALEADWERFGLTKVYPTAEMMLRESQRLNADNRYRDFNILRSNPRLCGFSMTGLLDHVMAGEGLWTYWRRFKPEMFDAVSDGWAPLRFCLFAPAHQFRGEPARFEAWLANEGELKPGVYTADFAIVGEKGTEMSFSRTFTVPADTFAVRIFSEMMTADLPAGRFTFTAWLREGGAPRGNTLKFYVSDRADMTGREVAAVGLSEEAKAELNRMGLIFRDDARVVLAGSAADPVETTRRAQEGTLVIFLSPDPFRSEDAQEKAGLPIRFIIRDYRDYLYHKECVMTPNTVFDDFGTGLVDFPRFGQTFPHPAYEIAETPEYVICPSFFTGYHDAPPMGYAALHSVFAQDHGAGRLLFNCFEIEENLGSEPAAGILLRNMIDWIDRP